MGKKKVTQCTVPTAAPAAPATEAPVAPEAVIASPEITANVPVPQDEPIIITELGPVCTEVLTTVVKCYKVHNDQQASFCGEPVKTDEDGREYFLLPDHTESLVKQHINLIWPK